MGVERKIRLGTRRASWAYRSCDKNRRPWDEDTARSYSFQLRSAHLCLRFARQKLHFLPEGSARLLPPLFLPLWHRFNHLIGIRIAPRLMFTLRARAKPVVTMLPPPPPPPIGPPHMRTFASGKAARGACTSWRPLNVDDSYGKLASGWCAPYSCHWEVCAAVTRWHGKRPGPAVLTPLRRRHGCGGDHRTVVALIRGWVWINSELSLTWVDGDVRSPRQCPCLCTKTHIHDPERLKNTMLFSLLDF